MKSKSYVWSELTPRQYSPKITMDVVTCKIYALCPLLSYPFVHAHVALGNVNLLHHCMIRAKTLF